VPAPLAGAKEGGMSSVQEILSGYDGLQAGQEAFYKDLHQHPELSHQEQRTAGRVASQLQEYNINAPIAREAKRKE
jgi:metal-dependent amidase/aminoacylase/carboxypeptidase family protein